MLYRRDLIHVVYFIKKYNINKKSNKYRFMYSLFKKTMLIFFSCVMYNYIRYKKIVKGQYYFNIKVGVCSLVYIKSVIAFLYSFLGICKVTVKSSIFFKRNKKSGYTLLRSPFVFKKSREQLVVETNYFDMVLDFKDKVILTIEFIELLLYNFVYKLDFLKVIIKKKIISK